MTTTTPTNFDATIESTAPALAIEATYLDPVTGALYVHEDLREAIPPWAAQAHIGPFQVTEKFGDVDSFAEYVRRIAADDEPVPLLTWNEHGLRAVLDYGSLDNPGAQKAIALHSFVFSPQWLAWASLANGQPRMQKQLVESLEDLAEDIISPDQAALLEILRTLRTTASASGETVINPDGTTSVSWTKESTIKGKADIPASIGIVIPVLKGHYVTDSDGQVRQRNYEIPIRLRLSVDDGAHVLFRLSMPTAERLLEKVYADRVEAAREALGDGYSLLRAG